ncbi:DUF1552 domain-containing protein [Zavarzinella formosa]|uniref:DUF1552 domain-containing protein n=1 Tax=Zavarzinella formosa TaxID=360055 RepID=UPI0002EE1D41|nr:DUF1552 domain-containing protein [Zavarzinella formosa]
MRFPVLNRRTFLRSSGVCIGLPLLDAMLPVGLGAEKKAEAMRAKRMLLISRPLGYHAPYFFPEKAGMDYEATRYLKPLQDHRKDFTVFSGMSHRGYPGGHHAEVALFTGVAAEGVRDMGDIRNTISLDQEAAQHLGGETRFPYLSLGGGGTGALSWNRKGVKVPAEGQATQVFRQLFIDGTPAEIAREVQRIQTGRSILDGVRDQANSLAKTLGPGDRQRLDMMLNAIREAEQRLQQDHEWVRKPKPKVAVKPFMDDYLADQRKLDRDQQWLDLAHLALQTDSTRVIALWLWSYGPVNLQGVAIGHHDATHHGQDEAKIRQLAAIEEAEMKLFGDFLGKMKATDDGGRPLLDRTAIFYGSNMGNASAHSCDNLPVILAGGGFKHAGHVAFDRRNNKPLSNLFVRMLQQSGVDMDRFGSSTGVLSEV